MRPISTSGQQVAVAPEEWGQMFDPPAIGYGDIRWHEGWDANGNPTSTRYQQFGTDPSTGEILLVERPVYREAT